MSVARHHAEWLSLTETSGPFLSLSALLRAFPQELDTLDSGAARRLRAAHEEWQSSQEGAAAGCGAAYGLAPLHSYRNAGIPE